MGNIIDKGLLDRLIENERIRAGFTDLERYTRTDVHEVSASLAAEIARRTGIPCAGTLIELTVWALTDGNMVADKSNETIYRLLEAAGYSVEG